MQENYSFNYKIFLIINLFLLFWGLLEVTLTSIPFSLNRYGTPWYYFFQQLIKILIGFILAIIIFFIPLEKFKKIITIIFPLNLLLMFGPFLPKIGASAFGASRWINIFGFQLQPAEFLKISFLLYLSLWLSKKNYSLKNKKKSFKFYCYFLLFIVFISILFFLQKDMGTFIIIAVIGVLVYFSANTPIWQTVFSVIFGIIFSILFIMTAGYRMKRIQLFLNPEADPLGLSYQFKQGLYALGSGGKFGIEKGFAFGLSRQKFGFLPQPMIDSIFCVIGEELGFFGTSFLIILFLLFEFFIIKLSEEQKDDFKRLSIIGLGSWIVFQAFLNIGGLIGVLPLVGVPLPFFSYGGSHLISELIAVGTILKLSKE